MVGRSPMKALDTYRSGRSRSRACASCGEAIIGRFSRQRAASESMWRLVIGAITRSVAGAHGLDDGQGGKPAS
jgi:pyruvate/2-oxoacid:ferredoxin oxidoreductase beta subunit